MEFYKLPAPNNNFRNLYSAQDKCKYEYERGSKITISWDDAFNSINCLWEQNTNDDEIQNELRKNIRFLYFALKNREPPPDDIIQKFCRNGLFVDMFSSLKTTGYKDFILGIICFILKRDPSTISIYMERNLLESFNTFLLSSQSMTEEMQICSPYYVSFFLKCVSKSSIDPYYFLTSSEINGISYFQLSCQIIETCLAQEREQAYNNIKFKEAHKYIQKTENNIYSMFSYFIKWIPQNAQSNKYPELNPIFFYISNAFEFNISEIYYKLLACLNRIWDYSYDFLWNYFVNPSIYSPICQIVNKRQPINAQENAVNLLYGLLRKNMDQISEQINAESVFNTANETFAMMMGEDVYDKTTINSILLLGQKFLIDKTISIDVKKDMNTLLGMVDALLSDMRYEAKNAAAFLVFVLIQLSNLTFFQDVKYKMDIIGKAFDAALSGRTFVLENAVCAAIVIYGMINNRNAAALTLKNILDQFIAEIYEVNDNENEELSERINYLYNNFILKK